MLQFIWCSPSHYLLPQSRRSSGAACWQGKFRKSVPHLCFTGQSPREGAQAVAKTEKRKSSQPAKDRFYWRSWSRLWCFTKGVSYRQVIKYNKSGKAVTKRVYLCNSHTAFFSNVIQRNDQWH